MRNIDGLTLYFYFQCFTSPLLIEDENQFWAKITKPTPAEITKPQPGYGFYEECSELTVRQSQYAIEVELEMLL